MTAPADLWACDTSVAVAALDPQHEAHHACRKAVTGFRPALAGHAAFEAHSVLTRLPVTFRLTAEQAGDVLERAFPEPCWLDPAASTALLRDLAAARIVGGAVYDALVGRAAAVNGRVLLTRDRRALRTYRALDVEVVVVG